MARDYASEFRKLFNGGCSVTNKDWNAPKYFDSRNNDCYAAEAALMSSLTSEAYSNFGFEVDYYIKDIDLKQDRLYGEDPLENVVRRFRLKMYTDTIPTMQKTYTLQGMDYQEVVTCHCTIQHFMEASQYDYISNDAMYDIAVPKIGDIVYLTYSELFYEVINVKQFAEGSTFLSSPITYMFTLRAWKNNHETVDMFNENNDRMQELRNFTELDETFDLDGSSFVDAGASINSINKDLPNDVDKYGNPSDNVNLHTQYIYPEPKESNPKYIDPFDGW